MYHQLAIKGNAMDLLDPVRRTGQENSIGNLLFRNPVKGKGNTSAAPERGSEACVTVSDLSPGKRHLAEHLTYGSIIAEGGQS